MLTCFEICAGAGGQALGLHMAGFKHIALIEYEQQYCDVLVSNMPNWNVVCTDVRNINGKPYQGKIDLFAGGVPCPPFSVASKQLGSNDERDLFPESIRLISEILPKAILIENVRGFLSSKFDSYRNEILSSIKNIGYNVHISILNASDYGVPQLRPRAIIIGIRNDIEDTFEYPKKNKLEPPTVGECLKEKMGENGWKMIDKWINTANKIAPTIVGGSKKHGGPDLGPVRARKKWAEIGIDGMGIADNPPEENFEGMPRLTKEMVAILQGFPPSWHFGNKKTIAYRMIGNAFPPPVAKAVGKQIRKCLNG